MLFSAVSAFASRAGARMRRLWLDGANMSDAGVESTVQSCPHLTLLSLSFSEDLTDAALGAVRVSVAVG